MFTEELKTALKKELRYIEEGIEYMEATDTAYTRCYTKLMRRRNLINHTIKRIERMDK